MLHDAWLKSEASQGIWQGKVHYVKMEESPNFYLKHQTGVLSIEKEGSIRFAKSPDDLLSADALKFKTISTHFYCSSPDPCSMKSYLALRKNEMTDEFAFQSLSKGVDSFLLEKRIDKPDSCFVLEFEQALVHYFDSYLVCPYDFSEESNIKQAVRVSYDELIKKLDLEDKDALR